MKVKWQYLIAAVIFIMWIMACGLPVTITAKMPGTATPNVNLTAIKALETLLTPSTPTPTATETPLPTATNTPVPTNTPTSTLTNTPTSTSTSVPYYYAPVQAQARYGGSFYAHHFWSPPSIDGGWDDWGGTTYYGNYLVYGGSNWSGESDASSTFRVGWDNDYLYIAAKVRDDHYAQNAGGQDIYMGDSLEILFDSDLYGDFYTAYLSGDDYQMGISGGRGDLNGTKEAVVWFPKSGNGSRSDVRIASMSFDGGYRVEAAIPWGDLGTSPYAGKHFGFVFSVSDNDNSSENVQQSMISAVASRRLTNPTTWGELILGSC